MCQIIHSPDYKKYNLGENHPFNSLRIEMVLDLIMELGLLRQTLTPEPINPEDLLAVHDKNYIDIVEAVSRGENIADAESYGLGNIDNPIIPGMAEGARYQVGGTVLGAKLLLQEKTNKVLQLGGGFHHAHKSLASGFCLYNDLAMAIKEMTTKGWHVAYIDIDVHHGDGVQEIFYSDEKVMCISIHESGEYLFPGSGWIHELGRGMGRSLKLNIPLEPYTEGESYLEVFNGVAEPALKWFRPDALVIQAGADAHFSDPLADLLLTTQDYEKLFHSIINYANKYSSGRALFTFGGGYSITATTRIWVILYLILFGQDLPEKLPENWINKWKSKTGKTFPSTLHDPINPYPAIPRKDEITRSNREIILRILDSTAADWI